MAKKYYWLRLKDDWFQSKTIKKLRRIAGGDTYTIIYLKMQLLSLKNEGRLYYEGVEESFAEELALELDEDPENVKVTISFLEKCGLLEITDADEYMLTAVPASIGSETESAERMRRMRAHNNKKLTDKKTSHCDGAVTGCDDDVRLRDTEIEIEKEIEKDKYSCTEQKNSEPQPMVEIEPAVVSQPKVEAEPVVTLGTKVEIEPSQDKGTKVEAEPSLNVFIKLPLIDHTDFSVTLEYTEYLQGLYPAVDVYQAFRNMRGWLDANPKYRKTPRGIKRFITGWLQRDQDEATKKRQAQKRPSPNRFNNFHQREYDFDELEKKLLSS